MQRTCYLKLGLALFLAITALACGSREVRIVEVTATPASTPIVVVATPTPDLNATVAAMVAASLPGPTSTVAPTDTPVPTDTPRPTYTPRPTATPEPTKTPDIPATVSARLTRVAPAPTLSPGSGSHASGISDMVQRIEGGLVQLVTPTGSGSGFVVSEDGLIVTNAHVVGREDRVQVRFVNGRSYTGEVLGRNELLDLAVVQVHSRLPFEVMTLGDAGSIRPGDEVVALGFPLGDELGRDYTVTTGVVSSRRTYGSVERIQTDAAINPGNSGGPLVNSEGRVIGVNTETYAKYEGISFAISVSEVRKNLDSLVEGGEILAEARGQWWTYENDDCQYSLLVHPSWVLTEESDRCYAYFERHDGPDLVGTINIWTYESEAGESLREFAEWWRDELVEQSKDWETFDLVSFGRSEDDHNGYVVRYLWRDTDEYCISSDSDLIVESSIHYNTLVLNAGMCSFMPQSAFDEIGSMEFGY